MHCTEELPRGGENSATTILAASPSDTHDQGRETDYVQQWVQCRTKCEEWETTDQRQHRHKIWAVWTFHVYISMCMHVCAAVLRLYPVSINLLNESLQSGHPAWSKMAVLEEDPPPAVHSLLHHALSYWSLVGGRTCRKLARHSARERVWSGICTQKLYL